MTRLWDLGISIFESSRDSNGWQWLRTNGLESEDLATGFRFSTWHKVLGSRNCAQPPGRLIRHSHNPPGAMHLPCPEALLFLGPHRLSPSPRLLRRTLSRSSHAVSNKVNDPKYAPATPLLGFQPTETDLHATKSFAREHPRWLRSRQPEVEHPG